MPIKPHEIFEGSRLGVSFLKLSSFSIGQDLERAINSIQSAIDKPPIGVGRRIVQQFEYIERDRELYLSVIVEVPIKIKELVVDGGEIEIKERTDYYTRNVHAIIRMEKSYIVIFAQNQREVKEFANYLRELTAMKLNPVAIQIAPEKVRETVKEFETIQQLKITMDSSDPIKFIRFSGEDLLDSPIVREILSDEKNEIIEIAGIKFLSYDNQVKLHLNNKGRLWIYKNPEEIDAGDIYHLLRDFEKTSLEEDDLQTVSGEIHE